MAGVRQFNEREVLSQALEVFWRQGLAATTMLDLAEATGVQRGSLYNAYGDKEAIFLRAFDLYATRFLASARASLEADDAEHALAGFFRAAIANMTSGSPHRGCLTTKTASDGSAAILSIKQELRSLLDRLVLLVEEALTRENIRPYLHLAPEEAAKVIVTFTRGLAVMERIYGDRNSLVKAADALVRSLVFSPAGPRSTTTGTRSRSPRGGGTSRSSRPLAR